MPWDSSALDLDAYLARTGASVRPPSLAALTDLLVAHARTFPFDNVDVLLEQHPGVSLEVVQEKFVGRGRGGYCFEHGTLVHAVLDRLGYAVEPHLGRVGDVREGSRTHLTLVVTLDGVRYLCDPGIGVPPLAPVALADHAQAPEGLWPHEIRETGQEQPGGSAWELWRRRTDEWELMHLVDELPARRIDVEMGHLWTSTAPTSHFRSALIANRHQVDPDGTPALVTINEHAITEGRAGEEPVRGTYDLAELPELLTRVGAHLSEDEAARLIERVRELRGLP